MAATRRKKEPVACTPMVAYHFEDRTYQIDADRRKVYNRMYVEIETSKAAEIMASWRSQNA